MQSKRASSWFTARQAAESVYGFKVLVDEETDLVLGAHLVGPHADEVINLFALAIRHDLTAEELKKTLFAYPTGGSDIGTCFDPEREPLDATHYFAGIAENLAPPHRPGFAALFVALLHELGTGRPVSLGTLASALRWPVERVTAVLERAPDTEYDEEGDIVGYGLTLRETAHALEIDGQRLYTWCALDTLIFPAVLGRTARVVSHCAATGAPIVFTVTPSVRAGTCCCRMTFVEAKQPHSGVSENG